MWKPKWGDPCPCGSGKRCKDCCWQGLPGFDIGKAYRQAVKEKKLKRAGGLATATSFFELKPNIAGIDINFNAMIDYFARRKTTDKT
jgi:hypothetical protein